MYANYLEARSVYFYENVVLERIENGHMRLTYDKPIYVFEYFFKYFILLCCNDSCEVLSNRVTLETSTYARFLDYIRPFEYVEVVEK